MPPSLYWQNALQKRMRPAPTTPAPVDPLTAVADESRTMGTEATRDYLGRAKSFDARTALADTAGSLFDRFEKTTGRRLNDLRGSMVGSGRLDSGYGAEAEDELLADSRDSLN